MNEISAEQSEAIIEAAARGQVLDSGGPVGNLLADLHAPGEPVGAVPALGGRTGFAGRVARRSAVAASAAVLGLAGVAAAATGTIAPFDDATPVIVENEVEEFDDRDAADEQEEIGVLDEESPVETDSASEPGEVESELSDRGNRPEIDGVDPSDGLDDAELELTCAGAENHGHYVSMVAHDKVTEGEGTHGDRVRDAATSDCGKADDDDGPDDADDADDVDDADDDDDDDGRDDDDDDDADEHPGQGHGHGHDKAKGNGHNGNGNNGRGHDRD